MDKHFDTSSEYTSGTKIGSITIDGKVTNYYMPSHTHSISNITNLQSSLDAKVPTSRTVNGKALSSNISLTASDVGAAASSHSHNAATTSAAGFMSAADKTKLDGIATGANKYSLPKASSSALGGVKIGFTESGRNYPVELNSNGQMYVNVPWYDSSYSTATKSVSGLMSASDKSKLDGIASGATSVSFTRSLTSGTKIGTIKINGSSTDLYCNATGGSSGTTISA